jgi:hypothetical protein
MKAKEKNQWQTSEPSSAIIGQFVKRTFLALGFFTRTTTSLKFM